MGSDRNEVSCTEAKLGFDLSMYQNEMQNSDERACCVHMSFTAGQLCDLLLNGTRPSSVPSQRRRNTDVCSRSDGTCCQ